MSGGSGKGAYYKAKYGGGGRGGKGSRGGGGDGGGRGGGGNYQDDSRGGRSLAGRRITAADLGACLTGMEGAPYGAYKSLLGAEVALDEQQTLFVDSVQADGFAPPSRIRLRVSRPGLPTSAYQTKARAVAAADYLARSFFQLARASGDDERTEEGGWGGRKGGELRIAVPSQFVLERSSLLVTSQGDVEVRLTVALPSNGRSIQGRWCARVLCDRLSALGRGSLLTVDAAKLIKHVECCEAQQFLRGQLRERGLAAFIGDGARLPRRSGADDRPMEQDVVPTLAPEGLAVTLDLPDKTQVRGLGIPLGVSLVCGGGFHGKSTLLEALQLGVYDKVPGDGRELVVIDSATVKIRAEDGRCVHSVDISPFIGELPRGKSTRDFSSDDASGSTSQAASICEALECEAKCLLFDEDTCATNFMIRDEKMRQLVPDNREPIRPYISRVRGLWDQHAVSSILVVGGAGDYLGVADTVIVMDDYAAQDATARAKAIIAQYPSPSATEAASPFASLPKRAPDSSACKAKGRTKALTMQRFQYGDNNDCDIAGLEQVVEEGQTRAIMHAISALAGAMNPRRSLLELNQLLETQFEAEGLDCLSHVTGGVVGDLARPRSFEVAAALCRLRTARFTQIQPSA